MTQNTLLINGPITVTISGPQGSGKSTLAAVINEAVKSLGIDGKVTVAERQSSETTVPELAA